MKVLLDPVYTNEPQWCSMSYKMRTVCQYLLDRHDNVFFYWFVPETECPDSNDWQTDFSFYPESDRIKLVSIPVHRDRYRDYVHTTDKLRRHYAYRGPLWDFDILVTSRIMQVPYIRLWMHFISSVSTETRRIVTVEDMPIMSFKKTVRLAKDERVSDRMTIEGYLAAHTNCFISFWEKDAVAHVMKKDYSPAARREFLAKSHDTSPIKVGKCKPKPKWVVEAACNKSKPLTVGYTQRWEVIHRKSLDIVRIMEKQFIRHAGSREMRFIITSNSRIAESATKDFHWLEARRAPRDEFWRMMVEEVDVILIMTICDDYSQSLIEPLTMGTPAIVLNAQYARPTLGEDYPFLVESDMQAYALINDFAKNYGKMYERFVRWQQGTFQRLMSERNDVWLPYFVEKEIAESRVQMGEAFRDREPHPLVQTLVKELPDEFRLDDEMQRAYKEKRLQSDIYKIRATEQYRLSFDYLEWYRFKADLITHYGYREASVEPGHLRKTSA